MNLYSVDSTVTASAEVTNFMDAGIHENVKLTEVRYDVSPNKGSKFINFVFENEKGEKLSHTEWETEIPDNFQSLDPSSEDYTKVSNKIKNQMKRIKQIVVNGGILKDEDFNIKAASFENFSKQLIAQLGTTYSQKLMRVKVIYGRNNYTSLPSYAKFPFIESMAISKEKSKIKPLPIDKMSPDSANYESKPKNDSDVKDDLPF